VSILLFPTVRDDEVALHCTYMLIVLDFFLMLVGAMCMSSLLDLQMWGPCLIHFWLAPWHFLFLPLSDVRKKRQIVTRNGWGR